MPGPLQHSSSREDYDTGYAEQWLSVGTPTVIQVATKPTEEHRVRFVARGATGLIWSGPTAVVPDVSSLQPLAPWVKAIRDAPRAPAGALRRPGS